MKTIAKLIGYAIAIGLIGWSVWRILDVVQSAGDRLEIQIKRGQP